MKKRKQSCRAWLWEFTKRVVVACFLLAAIVIVYAAVAMWRSGDYTSLPTLIECARDLLRDCIFGYIIKAGVENVAKIALNRTEGSEDGAAG